MRYEERVPEQLFNEENHYLGRPADFEDRIIQRRLRLVEQIPDFVGKEFTLLDIGCGNGASVVSLAPKMKSALGVDINDGHKKEIESYIKQKGVTNCEFRVCNIEKEELPQQFDRIISFEVIEHLEDENSVKNYAKALKNDGILAITVPNKWWIFETHGAKLPLLPWNRVPLFSWLPTPIHERFANARIYTKNRIKTLLEKNGFLVQKIEYITAPMDVLPKGKFKDFVIKNFFNSDTTEVPFKSTSIFVIAVKK